MPLPAGSRLGQFEIVSPLGAGCLARFQGEAQVPASLTGMLNWAAAERH